MKWMLVPYIETIKKECGCAYVDGNWVMVCHEHNEIENAKDKKRECVPLRV